MDTREDRARYPGCVLDRARPREDLLGVPVWTFLHP